MARILVIVVVGVLALTGVSVALAQTGPGWPGAGRGHGPMLGMHGSYPAAGAGGQATTALTLDQAVEAARTYVARLGNADLVLDEAMEFEQNFYIIVKEQSTGIGAFELLVDKATGNVFPEFGPDMMWNTKYGHMAGFGSGMMNGSGYGGMMGGGMMRGAGPGSMPGHGPGGMMGTPGAGSPGGQGMMSGWGPTAPTTAPTVTADQATQIARQWLDTNQPGSMTEPPDAFYGYYTLHIMKDGTVTGMLSVNAYTGQVWYHTWHGAFVQMREIGG